MKDYLDKIDAYMAGTLSPTEVAELEQAIDTDPSLALVVKHYDQARSMSRDLLDVDMRSTLEQIRQDEKHTSTKSMMPRLIAVVAIVVLLLLAWTTYKRATTERRSDMIFADSSLHPTASHAKNRGAVIDKVGYDYLHLNQYDKAIEAFKHNIGREAVDQDQLYYALAYTCAVKGDHDLALSYVRKSKLPQARKLEAILTQ